MPRNFASLGELLPDTEMRCRVKGCNNLWSVDGSQLLDALGSDAGKLPERMCESCFERFKTLQDKEVQCAGTGCSNTWAWTRFQQLEAHARGFDTPPKRLCEECQTKKQDIQARDVPCRVKGCKRTWAWSPEQQMTWEGQEPPRRLCDRCYQRMRDHKDREIECRMHGCSRTWTWTRFNQLEHEIAGKQPDKPPRRMCEACFAKLNTLDDRELPCNAPGCTRTWTFNRFAQLENILEHGDDAPPPERFCQDCFNFFRKTRDRRRRCSVPGCKTSWPYTRMEQLSDWLAGRTQPEEKICDDCAAKLKELHPKEVQCMVPGCTGAWIFTPEEQLKNLRLHRVEPPAHRCNGCETFLAQHDPQTLNCRDCGTEIKWSAYEQLLVQRGKFKKPEVCPDCAEKEFSARRDNEPVTEDHHHVVRIPAGGKWGSDRKIAQWPPHLDHEVVEKAEAADIRIVALGDDATYSAADRTESWPFLLEEKLNSHLMDHGKTAVVVNAGMPETTSAQALKRLPRDVWPFAPHLVLASLICGDSRLPLADARRDWQNAANAEHSSKEMEQLLRTLKKGDTEVVFWTPNPIFPQELIREGAENGSRAWAEAQQSRRNQIQSHAIHVCHTLDIPVLDLHARFEVNGARSARKWMADWQHHNAAGARNIATWMADYILSNRGELLGIE